MTDWLQILSYLLMAIGLVGTFAPLVPGAGLIWLGALLWAWADGFQRVGWPTLLVLFLFVLLSLAVDALLTAFGARRGGASWQGLLLGALGAVVGFFVFQFIGAVVGGLAALLLWEARRHGGDWGRATRAGVGAVLGYLVSAAVRFLLGLFMEAIFLWQAWL
ncbi:MAG: DUF456 domain-containing protein [Caldilineales bacterium]|nr:DUF456 domain-containing protein [Caldilineales bacterium]